MANLTINLNGDAVHVMDIIHRIAQCDKEPVSAELEKEITLAESLSVAIDQKVPNEKAIKKGRSRK